MSLTFLKNILIKNYEKKRIIFDFAMLDMYKE